MTNKVKFTAVERAMQRAFRVSTMRKLFHRPNARYASVRASDLSDAFQRRYTLATAEVR